MACENLNVPLFYLRSGNSSAHSFMAIFICIALQSFILCMQGLVFSQRLKGAPLQVSGTLSLNTFTFVFCLVNSSYLAFQTLLHFPSTQWGFQTLSEAPSVHRSLKSTSEYKSEVTVRVTSFISLYRTMIFYHFPTSDTSDFIFPG